MSALASELPSRNGWSIAEQCGDLSPDCTQRRLNRASWDEAAAMSQVRRHAVAGLDDAARRSRRRRMTVGALDETGQEKSGTSTAGVKRQYMGCAGRVANGISTVHLSYVRDKTGHALIGARQWVPREDVKDPVRSLVTGLPLDLRFRTKGQLAIDILGDARADGLPFDFICGDEVYGSCTELREHLEHLEQRGQAYVLRVASSFTLALAPGTTMTCQGAVKKLLKDKKRWEVRSAGEGSKGGRWYAWAWIATASPRHSLLVRRHLKTGDLACQARLYTAILRHLVLVMAALAICADTAAQLRHQTDAQSPPPARPDQQPPADPGLIPLTVHEVKKLLADALHSTWTDRAWRG